ncbi:putative vacuolar protein sorting-associated protein 13A [Sesbania bispinosa]|nr:putative vacuolar protein sorting-associated protein 13A [Sesbania bispinosa]
MSLKIRKKISRPAVGQKSGEDVDGRAKGNGKVVQNEMQQEKPKNGNRKGRKWPRAVHFDNDFEVEEEDYVGHWSNYAVETNVGEAENVDDDGWHYEELKTPPTSDDEGDAKEL